VKGRQHWRVDQAISRYLFLTLLAFVQRLGGTVFYAPLRVRVAPGRFREPNLVLLLDVHDPRNQNAFWLGADLVVEIVSPDHVERDTVLTLEGGTYVAYGVFRRADTAASALLQGFTVPVEAVCDAE
jgi:hypothetical protein